MDRTLPQGRQHGTGMGTLNTIVVLAGGRAGIILFCGGLSISAMSGVHTFAAAAASGGPAFMGAGFALAEYARVRA